MSEEKKTEAMTIETAESKLVGMAVGAAKALLTELGFKMRVGSKDGEQYMLTTDFNLNRLTVDVEKDVVVSVKRG